MKMEQVKVHTWHVLFKFAVYLGIITLMFTLVSDKELGISFGTACTLSILSYIGGDLFMLPIMGNGLSTLGDFILNCLTFYMVSRLFALNLPFPTLLLTAFLTCIFEYYFHQFLAKKFDFQWEV
jgi:hypothetical protein